ncbi:MAG: starch-binding protein [Ruminococcaceae bacterium]|nr:starch-binding protein [Oscillospiraceae bacterium]
MKKFLSIILALVILVSMMPYTVFAEEVSTLSYEFTGTNADDPGYAEGTITFNAASSATYYLYWGDETGALPQYFEITSFTAQKGSTYTYKFPAQTAIPADAECVFVSKAKDCESASRSENIAEVEIPDSKKLFDSSSERQYRYAAFSDIHIDMQHGTTAGFYTNSTAHWAQALDVCVDREVDFIISSGDQVTNAYGATLEWLTYQQILADSDYVNPIYESDGNHEPRGSYNSNCDSACSNEEYSIATGLDVDAQSIVDGKDYYEVTEPNTGDHFIFMSEVHAHPGENDNFSKEQLDWLEGLLAKYKDDGNKIFLIEHALIQGYGAGDDTYDPGYQGGIRMEHAETGEQFPNNQRFKKILEENKEIIWYSGHTHIDFTEEQNYSSENGASCHMVHIPSACNTTRYEKDANGYKILGSSTDYTFFDDTTQGYFVDVFDTATVLYGTNLHYNKVYPRYTYIIEEGEPETRPTEETQPRPTVPQPTQPDIENGKTVYCINSANWATISAYAWIEGGAAMTWPGNLMTKTGETVNGFDVYMAVVEPEYSSIIFNNNDNGSQTADLTIQENQYYDVKSGAWYTSLSDVPEVNVLATDRYIVGEFNGWSTVANEFKLNAEGDSTAYVTMSLEANKTYQFKVVREGTWTSCATPITDTVSGLTFSKSVSGNATITTKAAGDYVFSFGISSSQLGVTYPEPKPTEATEPTEPTEPTQPTEPTEPTEPTQPTVPTEDKTEPTEAPVLYGDVDLNGKIEITDATHIQRHLVELEVLTEEQLVRARVSGQAALSITDATLIQRKLASIIDKFPVENLKTVAVTSADTLTSEELFKKATDYLSYYFQYASYNDYQALKKTVYKYKDADTTALSEDAQAEITAAIEAFDALRDKVHQQTVYYTDGKGFGDIRAYYFNSTSNAQVEDWPGQIGSYIHTNSYGQNIYAVTLNFSKFDTIVFNGSGSNKTVDIALDGKSGTLYYPTDQDTTGAWGVASNTFKQMWYSEEKEDEMEDDVLEDITIYFTDTLGWSDVNCYYWLGSRNNTWPGEQMTFVRNNSQGQPIYKLTVPAGSSVVFNNGSGTQSVDVTGLTDGYGYYLTTLSSGKYLYESYKYGTA